MTIGIRIPSFVFASYTARITVETVDASWASRLRWEEARASGTYIVHCWLAHSLHSLLFRFAGSSQPSPMIIPW